MPLLSRVLASSALALVGLLVAPPGPVAALVTPAGSGSELGHLAARHLVGVSPNHNALARRKRNVHKNRKRCQQRPVSASSSSTSSAPQQTNNGNNNSGSTDSSSSSNNNNNNNNSNNNTSSTYQPPAPSYSGSGKLLLAWPNGLDPAIAQYFTGKASRYYNWTPQKVDGAPTNVPFCPMLWGDNQIDQFSSLVKQGYADCVLGMNEPNQQGQSDMDVGHGVWMWNTYIGPLVYQGYNTLVSPATTSAPSGLTWIQGFLNGVTVKPTAIALHWYDVGFDNFQQYVTNFYNNSGYRPIWITEFACQNFNGGAQCSQDQVWAFVQQACSWMDSTSWIQFYAPFGFMRDMQGVNDLNRLMNQDGSPTALGSFFIYSS